MLYVSCNLSPGLDAETRLGYREWVQSVASFHRLRSIVGQLCWLCCRRKWTNHEKDERSLRQAHYKPSVMLLTKHLGWQKFIKFLTPSDCKDDRKRLKTELEDILVRNAKKIYGWTHTILSLSLLPYQLDQGYFPFKYSLTDSLFVTQSVLNICVAISD